MTKITQISGKGVPVKGNEIDTDRIIPARFMKTITFDGLGEFAFYDARFDEKGNKKNHSFNKPEFHGASILVVNKNFGCGSSREHAPQSLKRWGVKAIIGESFAEIFAGNCQLLGMPCVTASTQEVEVLQDFLEKDPAVMINVNLEESSVSYTDSSISVSISNSRKKDLIEGTWNTLGLLVSALPKTRENAKKIPYLNEFK
ncbi:MAG: 3-isopropylmalate dehydratase small subunit [Candidatus Diapherotrites archaeon CG11_big_fil_rev_8_21_14_0_20_37_9]|nr:MAG: 3-isopropylmalate dehydratase small subunit [Candidatus Diapherotrites archaeon CG11_big_fil_rev_8_21_14_0_20_37_9]